VDFEQDTNQADIVVINADRSKGPLEIRRLVVDG
jgi:hypothetical protein